MIYHRIITIASAILIISAIAFQGCRKGEAFVPEVETMEPFDSDFTQAGCGGTVVTDHGYGVSARGVCWSTDGVPGISDQSTTDGKGLGKFTSKLTSLLPGTRYYVRAWATNKYGTGYGNTMVLIAKPFGDLEGNSYKTVQIGDQIWLAENLRTSYLNDSTPIKMNIIPGLQMNCVWYDNDSAKYDAIYGKLYNWFAVASGKLCPVGWRVPTNADWDILNNYLGGELVAGGKLKTTDTLYWKHLNMGATNEVGFSAMPGGFTPNMSVFDEMRISGNFWSADTLGYEAVYQQLYFNSIVNHRMAQFKGVGCSVRCVME
jgi:uncharacterized protein (TIGR02145 family)